MLLQIASSLLWALQAAESPIAPGTIVHEPIGCMVAGQFPLIEAVIEPSASVARARVYFNSALGNAYYFVEMTLQDGRFVGKLPKPKVEATPLRYSLRATSTVGDDTETQEYQVQVVSDAAECPAGEQVAALGPPGAVTVFNAGSGVASVSGHGPCAYFSTNWRGALRLGVPQKASLMLGYALPWDRDDVSCPRGPMLALEPGIGGCKLSLGFSQISGDASRAAKLTLLRTWNPWLADDNATYFGVELTSSFWFHSEIIGSVGLLRRISARAGSRAWVVTAGIGFGL